jgi:hypothetical protein
MINFHLYIALLCSQCAKNVNPIVGIGACCSNRSLIFVLCFAISFRGYIPSSFPWFSKHEITIFMFAGDYYSLHHCIFVVSHLDMYRTKVLIYRTMVLMVCLTKVRR